VQWEKVWNCCCLLAMGMSKLSGIIGYSSKSKSGSGSKSKSGLDTDNGQVLCWFDFDPDFDFDIDFEGWFNLVALACHGRGVVYIAG
jgi:hypothetical protein